MEAEAGGEAEVIVNQAGEQNTEVQDAAAKFAQGVDFEFEVEAVHGGPVLWRGGLSEEIAPKASGEAAGAPFDGWGAWENLLRRGFGEEFKGHCSTEG